MKSKIFLRFVTPAGALLAMTGQALSHAGHTHAPHVHAETVTQTWLEVVTLPVGGTLLVLGAGYLAYRAWKGLSAKRKASVDRGSLS